LQVIPVEVNESQKNRAVAYWNRGNANKKKGDKEQAIADFRKALEIDPLLQPAKDALKDLGMMP
jgi:tetratricopeptide (TPR) repeat protein